MDGLMKGWQVGRQGTGYFKKLLFQLCKVDCYLIKYPPFTTLPPHKDPVVGHKHYRLNIILKGNATFSGKTIINWFDRVILFRPDMITHSVIVGSRWRTVLSIGWAVKEKTNALLR